MSQADRPKPTPLDYRRLRFYMNSICPPSDTPKGLGRGYFFLGDHRAN
jgi:hypothetical protein